MITTMGVSGDVGSFSEEAALLYAKKNNLDISIKYLIDMKGVLSAIEKNKIELGIFPIINFHGGIVPPAFDAMGQHFFQLVSDLWLDVQQCLLVLPGTIANQINKIASHPQGLAQCKNFLQHEFPNAEQIDWIDTARAAKDLADGNLSSDTAVIAPRRSAQVYGLDLINENIQDSKPNTTVFVIVKRYE